MHYEQNRSTFGRDIEQTLENSGYSLYILYIFLSFLFLPIIIDGLSSVAVPRKVSPNLDSFKSGAVVRLLGSLVVVVAPDVVVVDDSVVVVAVDVEYVETVEEDVGLAAVDRVVVSVDRVSLGKEDVKINKYYFWEDGI